ncbi:MAG: 3-deoxy-D-manno-octulosonic acid transferase, partial [Xanthobacteraceae bacterium]
LKAAVPALLTVIVPRHPARGAAIGQAIAATGLNVVLRSQERLPSATTDIYVADTMGEMGLFYRLAPIVFMGGSLVAHGGQNPIEAVKLGAAIVHGPHVFNFAEVYHALDQAGGALPVADEAALVRQLGYLLGNRAARHQVLTAAEDVVADLGGALQRTLAALQPYLLQLRFESSARDA